MKTVLITGATSYLGRRLTRRLLDEGIAVHALVRSSSEPLPPAKNGRCPIEHVYDGSTASVVRVIERALPDTICHLASVSTIAHTPQEVDPMETAILRLGVQLAEAASTTAVSRFILAGSYWQERGKADPTPTCLYAAMKQALEDILLFYSASTALRTASLRLFSVYGPGDQRGHLIGQLSQARLTGEELALSPGDQILEMIYVDDAVDAFLHAAEMLACHPDLSGRAWAVGSGERVTLRSLVSTFVEVAGPVRVNWGARAYRAREVMCPWSGPGMPGWHPLVFLKEGIARTLSIH